MEAEISLLDPAAELVLRPPPFFCPGPHGLIEEFASRPAVLLRTVHGLVGVADDHVRTVGSPLRDRDPDTRRDRHLAGLERDGFGYRTSYPVGDGDGLLFAPDVLQEDHELVAAEARCRVFGPQDRAKPISDA
jgi:hypothetical protein